MKTRVHLFTATALCGSLAIASTPAHAECTPADPTTLQCSGTTMGPVDVGANHTIANSGQVDSETHGVSFIFNGTLINRAGASIIADQSAVIVSNGGANIANDGTLDSRGTDKSISVIRLNIGPDSTGTITNGATGIIGHAGMGAGEYALIATTDGALTIDNRGIIHGDLSIYGPGRTTVQNGTNMYGTPDGSSPIINGNMKFGDGRDHILNAGTINGNLSLGEGSNGVINHGSITGDVLFGDGAPRRTILDPGNGFSNMSGATMTGNVTFGKGSDRFSNAGTINGNTDTGEGDDRLVLSGTINGEVRAGFGDDRVVIANALTLGAGGRIDAEGGDDDHIEFNGETGSWDAALIGGFEHFSKEGGGTSTITGGWNSFADITIAGGTLILASGAENEIGAANTFIREDSAYILNGVHAGDITVDLGGTLAGTGYISDIGIDDADVVSAGVVAPGHNGIGTLTLVSDYTQIATGGLDIELGAPGQSDRLDVGGLATLAGTVNFIPLDLANTGDYTFLTYGSRQGAFDTITGGSGLFFTYNVEYLSDRAIVNVVKTGAPPPPPRSACTPEDPGAGTVVICSPPIDRTYLFTAPDLTVRVEGMLDLGAGVPIIMTNGDNGRITVGEGAGIVNQSNSGAVAMYGATNRLVNSGLIAAPTIRAGSDFDLIEIWSDADQVSVVENRAIGVIGVAENSDVTAISGRGEGRIEVNNGGLIYGHLNLQQNSQAYVVNGLYGDEGELVGPARIEGLVLLTDGNDDFINRGTVIGAVRTGRGDDSISNSETGSIVGDIDAGDGDDFVTLDGSVVGQVDLGNGDDMLYLGGTLDGDVFMGDGDDRLEILFASDTPGANPLGEDRVIDGGEGVDRLILGGDNTRWTADQFTSFEALQKSGGGKVTLDGAWTEFAQGASIEIGELHLEATGVLAGPMQVLGGTYRVDGVHDGDVSIAFGGTLVGTGSIGTLERYDIGTEALLTNHGVVSPGNSIGTINVWGDYMQGPDGLLAIELGAPGSNDVLSVAGEARLDGAVQFIPLDAATLGSYTFLRAAGGVHGTFATVNPDQQLAQAGLFFTYAVDYGRPGEVSVNLSKTGEEPVDPDPVDPVDPDPVDPDPVDPDPVDPDPVDPDPVDPDPVEPDPVEPDPDPILDVIDNLTANQAAVRDAFLSDGLFTSDLAAVRADLDRIDPDLAAAALDSFSGEIHASTTGLAARAGNQFANLVKRRITSERLGGVSSTSQVRQQDADHETVYWMVGAGHFGRVSRDSGTAASRATSAVVAFGVDKTVGSDMRIGIAGGYSNADIEQEERGSAADIASYHTSIYATLESAESFADFQLGYTRHSLATSRRILMGSGRSRQALGDTTADEFRAHTVAGLKVQSGRFTLQPRASLGYVSAVQARFTEEGAGDAGLEVRPGDYETLTAGIGVNILAELPRESGVLTPHASLSLGHDLVQSGWYTDSRMTGGGNAFRIIATNPGRTSASAGIGLSATYENAHFQIGYELEAREKYASHSVAGGLSVRF